MGTSQCCCTDSAVARRRASNEAIAAPSQTRAHLAVKAGGFSLGAFAASNRGTLNDLYAIETKLIGEGSYGAVKRCQCKDTSQWRAVKTINKSFVKSEEQFKEEMAIMKVLDHPNIVRFYESFEDARHVYLVLELCTGGELFDRILADGKFGEQAAAACVQQMFRAVNYMHHNYIMHRDLKPENWLLAHEAESITKTGLKLIDFGLSKRFSPGEFASTKAGTPYYVAPEVLQGKYAQESDVWSIGVIMYILLCGSPPFTGNDTIAVLDSVKRARTQFEKKEWKHVSIEAKQMLKALLVKDPSQRLTAAEALNHAWVTKMLQMEEGQVTDLVMANLRNFALMNKLKKASLNVIVTQLSDNAIKELKDLFMCMDENNDGTLSVGELKEGLQKAGVAVPEDLREMMDSIDTDGSGVIDYSEFMAATMDKRKYIQEDVCWRAFKTFDVDGSGCIDKEELKRLLGMHGVGDVMQVQVTENEVNAIMQEVDLNGDGRIDFDEFLAMMRRAQNKDPSKQRVFGASGAPARRPV
mmetsp:Transcript_99098/g.279980  ORF Transcript_99098/g.279980 Transcript_99098/m.279980 type:complete len:526 (-) Transcript_99098:23-1600(-)